MHMHTALAATCSLSCTRPPPHTPTHLSCSCMFAFLASLWLEMTNAADQQSETDGETDKELGRASTAIQTLLPRPSASIETVFQLICKQMIWLDEAEQPAMPSSMYQLGQLLLRVLHWIGQRQGVGHSEFRQVLLNVISCHPQIQESVNSASSCASYAEYAATAENENQVTLFARNVAAAVTGGGGQAAGAKTTDGEYRDRVRKLASALLRIRARGLREADAVEGGSAKAPFEPEYCAWLDKATLDEHDRKPFLSASVGNKDLAAMLQMYDLSMANEGLIDSHMLHFLAWTSVANDKIGLDGMCCACRTGGGSGGHRSAHSAYILYICICADVSRPIAMCACVLRWQGTYLRIIDEAQTAPELVLTACLRASRRDDDQSVLLLAGQPEQATMGFAGGYGNFSRFAIENCCNAQEVKMLQLTTNFASTVNIVAVYNSIAFACSSGTAIRMKAKDGAQLGKPPLLVYQGMCHDSTTATTESTQRSTLVTPYENQITREVAAQACELSRQYKSRCAANSNPRIANRRACLSDAHVRLCFESACFLFGATPPCSVCRSFKELAVSAVDSNHTEPSTCGAPAARKRACPSPADRCSRGGNMTGRC